MNKQSKLQVMKSGDGVVPEWCTVGAQVAVYAPRRQNLVTVAKVAGVNKRYVTLDDGERYSIVKGLQHIAQYTAFQSVPFLADLRSPGVQYAQAVARREAMQYRVRKANDEFQLRPSRSTAAAVTAAVEAWSVQDKRIAVHFPNA